MIGKSKKCINCDKNTVFVRSLCVACYTFFRRNNNIDKFPRIYHINHQK